MPNTPALVGKGMTGLFARPEVSLAQRTLAQDVIAATGQTLWLDTEDQIDAVTAISGSGPAYVFYFMEAMQTAAVELGLTPDEGRRLTLQTFIGAAELAAQSSDPVAVLRERVTSKGGTTAAALASMAAQHLPEIIRQAARAAHGRSRDMAKEFGQP
jgi:pyrroline-5-carboxylate reductase